MLINQDQIWTALQVLNEADQDLQIDADINAFTKQFLHVPNNFPDAWFWQPAQNTLIDFPQEATDIIIKLNGPYAKTYAAMLLIKYAT